MMMLSALCVTKPAALPHLPSIIACLRLEMTQQIAQAYVGGSDVVRVLAPWSSAGLDSAVPNSVHQGHRVTSRWSRDVEVEEEIEVEVEEKVEEKVEEEVRVGECLTLQVAGAAAA